MKFRTRINTFKIEGNFNNPTIKLTKFEAIDTIDVNGEIVNIAYDENNHNKIISVEIAPKEIFLTDKYLDMVQSKLGQIFIFEYNKKNATKAKSNIVVSGKNYKITSIEVE